MARIKPTVRPARPVVEAAPTHDFEAFLEHVKEHPWQYIAGVAFVLICVVVALIYGASTRSRERAEQTEYMRALTAESPDERMSALEALAKEDGPVHAEALYMLGELAYAEQEYEKARDAFTTVRERYPDSPFAPAAIEGLGYILENEGKPAEARALYEEIVSKYPTSFTASRQSLNIGRTYEAEGKIEEARTHYQDQLTLFEDSSVAEEAEAALARLNAPAAPTETPEESADTPATPADTPAATEETPAEPDAEPSLQLQLPQDGEGDGAVPEIEDLGALQLQTPEDGALQQPEGVDAEPAASAESDAAPAVEEPTDAETPAATE